MYIRSRYFEEVLYTWAETKMIEKYYLIEIDDRVSHKK